MPDVAEAMFEDAFPVNPRPFLRELDRRIETFGASYLRSDEARQILFVVIAQSYGQLAKLDLSDEWERLYKNWNLRRMQEAVDESSA